MWFPWQVYGHECRCCCRKDTHFSLFRHFCCWTWAQRVVSTCIFHHPNNYHCQFLFPVRTWTPSPPDQFRWRSNCKFLLPLLTFLAGGGGDQVSVTEKWRVFFFGATSLNQLLLTERSLEDLYRLSSLSLSPVLTHTPFILSKLAGLDWKWTWSGKGIPVHLVAMETRCGCWSVFLLYLSAAVSLSSLCEGASWPLSPCLSITLNIISLRSDESMCRLQLIVSWS